MEDWIPLTETGVDEQRLRWLLRHDAREMVEAGVAMKFGRGWHIHRGRLPEYLRQRTLATLGRDRAQA